MRLLLITLFLVGGMTLFAQSSPVAGEYFRSLSEEGKHTIEYQLTLNQDGTFVFHSYSKMQGGIPPEETIWLFLTPIKNKILTRNIL